MIFVKLVVTAITLMIVVSGVYVFVVGCLRRKDLPWLIEEELKKTPYGKYAGNILDADHWLKSHNAQSIWMNSYDDIKLHGLWVPVKNPKGTMILVHGYRSSPLLDFGLAFPFYHDLGFNLLIPDQRSHGKSAGRFITFGAKESRDVLAWVAYHNKYFESVPVFLSGLSMGASTVLYLADKDLPSNVKGIIADCGFTSPADILSCVFRDVTHLPALPSILVTGLCTRLFAGFSLWECDTRKSLRASRIPIVMIHGKDDGFVPYEMSKKAYDCCVGQKQLMLVEGADHGVSFLVEPEKYIQLVTAFLEKNL